MEEKQQNKLHLFSLNVNGYSPDVHQWLSNYIENNSLDIIFLSETKRKEDDLKKQFSTFENYNYIINAHNPSRYHDVAMLINKKYKYIKLDTNLNIKCNIMQDLTKKKDIILEIF